MNSQPDAAMIQGVMPPPAGGLSEASIRAAAEYFMAQLREQAIMNPLIFATPTKTNTGSSLDGTEPAADREPAKSPKPAAVPEELAAGVPAATVNIENDIQKATLDQEMTDEGAAKDGKEADANKKKSEAHSVTESEDKADAINQEPQPPLDSGAGRIDDSYCGPVPGIVPTTGAEKAQLQPAPAKTVVTENQLQQIVDAQFPTGTQQTPIYQMEAKNASPSPPRQDHAGATAGDAVAQCQSPDYKEGEYSDEPEVQKEATGPATNIPTAKDNPIIIDEDPVPDVTVPLGPEIINLEENEQTHHTDA